MNSACNHFRVNENETEVRANDTEKKPWVTPAATIEKVSEATTVALTTGADGPFNCHS